MSDRCICLIKCMNEYIKGAVCSEPATGAHLGARSPTASPSCPGPSGYPGLQASCVNED